MEKSIMKKGVISLVLVAAVMLLCASGADESPADRPPSQASLSIQAEPPLETVFDSGYWVTRPSPSGLTIIGIAGRRANREAAVKEALADAARKAALYHGLHAESAAVLNQGSGSLDYFSDFDYQITPANSHETYLDMLDYDGEADMLEKNGVVMVRARYAVTAAVPPYTTAMEDGVPAWTKRYTADIPGFLTGVGHASNKGSLQKTCQASYETAIVSLLSQLSARIGSEVVDVAGARMTQNVTRSEGDLTGVIILETWLDKKTSAVWTLVAADNK
jgi:hypothetical protein